MHLRNSTAPTLHRGRVGVETRGGLWGSHLHLWPEAAFFPDVGTGNRAPLTRMRLQAPPSSSPWRSQSLIAALGTTHSVSLTSQVEGTELGGGAQLVKPAPVFSPFRFLFPIPGTPVSQPGSQVWGLCSPSSIPSQPVSEPVSCLQKGKGWRASSFLLLLQLVLPPPHPSAGSSLRIPERK